jgi:creatinine amidohydrolase
VLLKLAIWQDVEEYLTRRKDLIVPVGSTEQHGPSGPLGTDLIVAEELAHELGEERRALVAPAIPVGASSLHTGFPGTISVRPMTLLAYLRDVFLSLAAQGFRRFLVVNAHPGSVGILESACAQVQQEVPDARCLVQHWWQLPEVQQMLLELFGAREGHHATPGELSIVRKFYPRGVLDLPPMERFEPLQQPTAYGPADFRRRYPDGRVGSDPSLSAGGAGDRIFTAAARALIEAHRRLVEEP